MVTPQENLVQVPAKKRGRPSKGTPQAVPRPKQPIKSTPEDDKENAPILDPTSPQRSPDPKVIDQSQELLKNKLIADKENTPLSKPQPLGPSKGTPQAVNRLKQPFKLALSDNKANTPLSKQSS